MLCLAAVQNFHIAIRAVKSIVAILGFLFISATLPAQDSVRQSRLSLNGYVSDMPGLMLNSVTDASEFSNQFHNRLNFRWEPNTTISAALEIRNRFYYNWSTVYPANYLRGFEKDAGLIGMSKNLFEGDNYVFNISVDRLWVDLNRNKWQVTLGRQRINWGQAFVWNPNDIFNTYNYLDFDYVEKPGSDALRIQYYPSETSKAELALAFDSIGNPTLAGLYRFNRWNYDFQVLSGYTAMDDFVLGAGWAGQVAKGGFRGEVSCFMPSGKSVQSKTTLTASAGWDYMFGNSLFLQLECLYNGTDPDSSWLAVYEISNFKLSAKNPFLSGFSYFASAGYPVTPLFNGSVAMILNPENKVYILVPTLDYNLARNFDLSFIAQIIGIENQPEDMAFIHMLFLRLKYSF